MNREHLRAGAGALGGVVCVAACCGAVLWMLGDGQGGRRAAAWVCGALVGAGAVLATRPRGYLGWTVLGASLAAVGVAAWAAGMGWALVACVLAGAAGALAATTDDADAGDARRGAVRVLAVVVAELLLVGLVAWGNRAEEPEEIAWTEEVPTWPDGGEQEDAGVGGDVADTMDVGDARAEVFDVRGEVGRDVPRDRTPRDRSEVIDGLDVLEESVARDDGPEDDVADGDDGGIVCPSGMVGVPEGDPLLGGQREQRHVRGFCIDRTEVTVGQFRRWFTRQTNVDAPEIRALCNWSDAPGAKENHPINCVDWHQADAYCRGTGGMLPSNDEWEYAARGTDGREYPWGPAPPSTQLCWRRSEGTCRVGSFRGDASPFGALDMVGNVWEWTRSGSGNARSLRGGAWDDSNAGYVRAANSSVSIVSYRLNDFGFRCVRGSR